MALVACLFLSAGQLPAMTGLSSSKTCYEDFAKGVDGSMQRDESPMQTADLLALSRSFSQRMLRDTFRAYPAAVVQGNVPLTASLRRRLIALHSAWHTAYPNIPLPAPLPEALEWGTQLHHRYARAQKATEEAQRLYDRGEFRNAQRYWEQALLDFSRLGATFATSYLYMNLGLCAYEFGELNRAEALLRRAKAIHESYQNDAGIRDIKMNLSLLEEVRGRYPIATRLLLDARELNSSLCDDKTEARILSSLGVVALESGQLYEAESWYRQSLLLRRKVADVDGEALDTGNLAEVLIQRGLYPQALELFQVSLEIRRRAADREGEADSLLGVSKAYAGMGQTAAAMEYFLKAIQIFEELGSPQRTIDAWNQAGKFYYELGDFVKAEYFSRGGLDQAGNMEFRRAAAESKRLLAQALIAQNRLDEARELLHQALTAQEQSRKGASACHTLLELGILGLKQGNAMEGTSELLRAEHCSVEHGLAEVFIRTSLELGELAMEGGKPAIAEYHYSASARLAGERQLAHYEWKAWEGLSRSYRMEGRAEAARWHLQHSLKLVLEMEREVSLPSLALPYWDDKAVLFRTMSRSAEDEGDMLSAWSWADLMKARLAKRRNPALEERDISDENPAPGNGSEAISREELRKNYLQLIRTPDEKPARLAELRQKIAVLEASFPSTVLPAQPAPEPPEVQSAAVHLQLLQHRLAESEALVDYLVHPDAMRAWLVTKDDIRQIEIDLTLAELSRMMEQAGLSPDGNSSANGLNGEPLKGFIDPRVLRSLSERIWWPVARCLPRRIRAIIIVPDRQLHLLPFEILPANTRSYKEEGTWEGRYILQDYAISYLPAAALLEPCAHLAERSRLKAVALGTGAEGSDVTQLPARPSAPAAQPLPLKQENRIGGELEELRTLFPSSRFYRGLDGSMRGSFLQSVEESDIVHIASHYHFDPKLPEISRFALRLSPHAADGGEPLYAFEAASLRLHAALAVLSACGTGLGAVHPGEGLANMGRAFLLAGSRSVITSMWPVEEESTATLMRYFYRYLAEGMESREALRQAKLRLLETPGWRHPFYWGAFILSGKPVKIANLKKIREADAVNRGGISAIFLAIAAAAGIGAAGLATVRLRRGRERREKRVG